MPTWRVAPLPAPTSRTAASRSPGPVDRKMMINALNSGARVFMADFEDANSPTWENCVEGQVNLDRRGRAARSSSTAGEKRYRLNEETADAAGPAARLAPAREARPGRRRADVARASSTSASTSSTTRPSCSTRGTGPYFYLPKLESHLEARLWNDVFVHAQDALGIPQGSIKATVLIETILGRLRDGRDPLRAARALGRPERRALGLHLQRHQEVPRPTRLRAAGPGAGDDDRARSCARTPSCW